MTMSSSYLPFGLLGYVVGLRDASTDLTKALHFERLWYSRIFQGQKRAGGTLDCLNKTRIGQALVREWNTERKTKQFVYVVCGNELKVIEDVTEETNSNDDEYISNTD